VSFLQGSREILIGLGLGGRPLLSEFRTDFVQLRSRLHLVEFVGDRIVGILKDALNGFLLCHGILFRIHFKLRGFLLKRRHPTTQLILLHEMFERHGFRGGINS